MIQRNAEVVEVNAKVKLVGAVLEVEASVEVNLKLFVWVAGGHPDPSVSVAILPWGTKDVGDGEHGPEGLKSRVAEAGGEAV